MVVSYCMCWESNPIPLEDQSVFLTTEQCLQLRHPAISSSNQADKERPPESLAVIPRQLFSFHSYSLSHLLAFLMPLRTSLFVRFSHHLNLYAKK